MRSTIGKSVCATCSPLSCQPPGQAVWVRSNRWRPSSRRRSRKNSTTFCRGDTVHASQCGDVMNWTPDEVLECSRKVVSSLISCCKAFCVFGGLSMAWRSFRKLRGTIGTADLYCAVKHQGGWCGHTARKVHDRVAGMVGE